MINHMSNCLTVSAWDVIDYYERNGNILDHLFHFDGLSVAESDAELFLEEDDFDEIVAHLNNLPEGIREVVERWINRVEDKRGQRKTKRTCKSDQRYGSTRI